MLIADNRNVVLLFTTALVFLMSGPSTVASTISDDNRTRIGLVLSGGGALGFAHIGVLQVLEEMRIPVDCIVGTSMGALVGGVYASGVGPEQMQAAIRKTDIESLFDDKPPRSDITLNIKRDDYRPLFDLTIGYNDGIRLPSGVSAGYKFELFLKELIGLGASIADTDFDSLPTPYRAVATDLETGDIKVFDKGELPRVMRASMSLPAIVAPTVIDGRAYIDGGLVRNLPVDIGRKLCGDVLIAVNLGTRPKPKEQVNNSLEVALQSIVILTNQNVRASLQQLTDNDVLITPDLEGYRSSSFSSTAAIIARGIAAARSSETELSRLSVSPEEYKAWQENRLSKTPVALAVTEITAEVTGTVNTVAVKHDISEEAGIEFDLEKLDRNITEIYGRGDFSYVGYSIVPNEDNATVIIKAESKPWGPGYLKFGLGATTDFTSPTQLNLAASYRRTWINSLGAEWRTDAQIGYDSFLRTEFIQPLQLRDGLFVAPYALARRNFIQIYTADERLGDAEIERYQGGLDIGTSGHIGELRVGPFINTVSSKPGLGALNPAISTEENDQKGIELRVIIDQMDDVVFPRSGVLASLNIRKVNQSGDPDLEEYTRAQALLEGAFSFRDNTLRAHLEWGDEISGQSYMPVFETFSLGGPLRLSGLYLDQLTGYDYDLATVSYYRRYANMTPQLGRGIYVGMSIETGRIDDPLMTKPDEWTTSGSVYWGADTILGALYLGYGRSFSLNQNSFYLVIGPQF